MPLPGRDRRDRRDFETDGTKETEGTAEKTLSTVVRDLASVPLVHVVPSVSNCPRPHLVSGSQGLEEKPATEEGKVPLWQRIGDMFPEVKPQQSMEAWDDECPF